MILLEILFQPCEFGGKPGARVRTAARLCLALYIERDKVPRAQIIGIPAISDSDWAPAGTVVPSPPVCSKCPACPSDRGTGWGMGVVAARIVAAAVDADGHGSGIVVVGMVTIGIELEAVEVGEVAVAGNAGLRHARHKTRGCRARAA